MDAPKGREPRACSGTDPASAEAPFHSPGGHWPGNVRELRHFVDTAAVFAGDEILTSSDVALLLHREDHVATPHRRSFEEQRLIDTLYQCEWDVERAAERLGVHRATVYRRIKRLDRIGPAHHRLGSTVAERVSVTRR